MHGAQSEPSDVVLLTRTGRLDSWHRLAAAERQAATDHHVELMLQVAADTEMTRLEGYRLVTPEDRFERFWVMSFPGLSGAQTWIEAEMRRPYGRYGFYEYDFARPVPLEDAAKLVTDPLPADVRAADPQQVPDLAVDREHVAVICFGRAAADDEWRMPQPAAPSVAAGAHEYRLLEGFRLLGPRDGWHYAWLCVCRSVAGAEAWIDAQTDSLRATEHRQRFLLARRWQPDYFASWLATARTRPVSGAT